MYASRTTQLIVGIFGVMGILALAILSLRLGRVSLFPVPSYTIYANFDNVAGLKTNDAIEIAGVKVGKVSSISLNRERAKVQMEINTGVPIDDEAIAAIKTSGIIGDKYVSIALGGGDKDLKDGETLRMTQSAFVLEDAIGQLINSSGSSGSSSGGGGASPSAKATATMTPKTGTKPNP